MERKRAFPCNLWVKFIKNTKLTTHRSFIVKAMLNKNEF
jgi:hypothetical protein